jgi:predicted transcriptional regulator
MTATTIKVSSDLRDRLNDAAHDEGLTTGSFVERLLERYLREQRFASLREAMAAGSDEAAASYRAEMEAWDATSSDGPE